MIIENVDAFKAWLAKTLTPICDAEPVALAKYIVALVKKDKPESELKAVCLENLEVFLQSHTRSYVDKLFENLSSRQYLENDSHPPSPPNATFVSQSSVTTETSASVPVITASVISTNVSSAIPTNITTAASTTGFGASAPTIIRPHQRTSDDEISDDDRDHRRRQSPGAGPRAHSGDREKDERRRARSGGRMPSRRGALGISLQDRYPRHDRRRGSSPLARTRSRSPIRNNHLRESGVPSLRREGAVTGVLQSYNAADPVSAVPVLGNVIQSVSSVHNDWSKSHPSPYTLHPPPLLPKARCRDFDEKGFCMRGDLCSFDHGIDPVVVDDISNVLPFPPGKQSQQAGMGLNMPITMPVQLPVHQALATPGSHGPNAIPSHLTSLGPGPSRGDTFVGNRNRHRPPPPIAVTEAYNPEAPGIRGQRPGGSYWNGIQRAGRPSQMSSSATVQPYDPVHATPITRNVITIQRVPDTEVTPLQQQQPQTRSASGVITDLRLIMSPKRPMQRSNGRGGFGDRFGAKRPYVHDPTNATLEVRRIPPVYNNIAKLNEHFVKFGKVVSIQIAFDGDPEGALVTFSQNSEAYAAFRSSEPVFNNRFIRLYLYRPVPASDGAPAESNDGGTPSQTKENLGFRPSIHQRLSVAPVHSNEEHQEPSDNAVAQEDQQPALPQQAAPPSAPPAQLPRTFNPASMKLDNTKDHRNVLMKKNEESRKEFIRKQVELQKQKQMLLQKQLDQQKVLIAKVQHLQAGLEKDELMKAIRSLAQKTNDLKKELSLKPAKSEPLPKPILSKEQAAKELLDAELEMHNRQMSGQDASDLAARLKELRCTAAGLGVEMPFSVYGRGSAFLKLRGRGRPGSYRRSYSSEKPRKLLIIGFSPEEKDDVITHFNAFGALEDVLVNEAVPSAVVTYQHATDAGIAAKHGAEFNNKRLIMKWHRAASLPLSVNATALARLSVSSTGDRAADASNTFVSAVGPAAAGDDLSESAAAVPHDDEGEVDEELLLAGDDEEDDDNEKRSWR